MGWFNQQPEKFFCFKWSHRDIHLVTMHGCFLFVLREVLPKESGKKNALRKYVLIRIWVWENHFVVEQIIQVSLRVWGAQLGRNMNFTTLNLGWFYLKGLILQSIKQTTQVSTAISGEVDVSGPFHWEFVLQLSQVGSVCLTLSKWCFFFHVH